MSIKDVYHSVSPVSRFLSVPVQGPSGGQGLPGDGGDPGLMVGT